MQPPSILFWKQNHWHATWLLIAIQFPLPIRTIYSVQHLPSLPEILVSESFSNKRHLLHSKSTSALCSFFHSFQSLKKSHHPVSLSILLLCFPFVHGTLQSDSAQDDTYSLLLLAVCLPDYTLPEHEPQRSKCLCQQLSHVHLSATPRTGAHQASLSMGFSRQEYWSGLPFPSPGDLPNPGIEPRSPAMQEDSLPSELPGKYSSRICFFPYTTGV